MVIAHYVLVTTTRQTILLVRSAQAILLVIFAIQVFHIFKKILDI